MDSDLKEQIGQMLVIRASGHLFDHQIRYPRWEATNAQLQKWLPELNLGGVILLGGSAAEISLRTEQLQNWATNPLFVAADIEEGVGQRFPGATWFPPPMALGAIAAKDLPKARHYAYQFGASTAQEAQAIGINWILAPVVDVNNNPENPVINVRAFGESPEIVGELATAFIEGAQKYPLLTTAKHFPGHGDTATDSHLNLPTIPHSQTRLQQVEIPPFQRAIAAGVDSVMSAHLLIPAWDQERPATLSPAILGDKLRQGLGFEGLIVTDALIMGGVTQFASPGEIAVLAVEAGADILLMPENPEITLQALVAAVASKRLSEERIHQSLERIASAKKKISPLEKVGITSQLSQSHSREIAIRISQDSLLESGKLPLVISTDNSLQRRYNLLIIDDLLNCDFLDQHTPAVTIPQNLGYKLQIVDQNFTDWPLDEAEEILLQIFLRGNPFRGQAGMSARTSSLVKKILKNKTVQAVTIYGSPYVWKWFTAQLPSEVPRIFSYGQMPNSQAIVLNKLFNYSSLESLSNQSSQAFI